MASCVHAHALLVALETSTREPSVAARRGGRTLERSLARDRSHASDLIPALDEFLRELGAAPSSIAALFVGRGPGSYTGLRVGVATALGLARASGARTLGIASGEALAFAELAPGEEACHLVDVRQGALALARHRRVEGGVLVLEEPRLVPREEIVAALPEGARIFADEGSARALEGAPELTSRLRVGAVPSAAALLELGASRLAGAPPRDFEQLEPLYLRPFHALPRRR